MHEASNAFEDFLTSNRDLDQKVDSFLLGSQECDIHERYEPGVEIMLQELKERFAAGGVLRRRLVGLLNKAHPEQWLRYRYFADGGTLDAIGNVWGLGFRYEDAFF
jgi:hypothetical protein